MWRESNFMFIFQDKFSSNLFQFPMGSKREEGNNSESDFDLISKWLCGSL